MRIIASAIYSSGECKISPFAAGAYGHSVGLNYYPDSCSAAGGNPDLFNCSVVNHEKEICTAVGSKSLVTEIEILDRKRISVRYRSGENRVFNFLSLDS